MKIRGIAHRGYPVKYPENTLSSFQAAVDLSFTHLELDVHLSKDGIPVLMHDYAIERMSDGKGNIRDYTLDELKRFSIKGIETIPTLEEALILLKGKISILVELKQSGDLYPGLEEKVLEIIHKTDTLDQSRIIGFDHFSIAKTRQLNKDIKLGLCCSGSMPYVFPFMEEIDCDFLGVQLRFMTPKYAVMMQERGIISGPWPVDTLADMELIASKYPTDLITTNELERWAEFYQNHTELHVGV
ncbi:glycerophosphodiester phosphodiesterase [Paenibacillus nasutitermitis]|uniref:Glycerophosphoryl diester phosphodiesterase n=1 Tax=Paenibacillus nasutitermitis TaxID=1652958 RepID=A0A917DVP3_9BACL|nr:glycerophosphodiester phosphodiesterase family protein [Paenibacillus nasutitermitis]GGD73100.1 glycerophosphoryl diester phosphodiesterase [Paenibacillus nasutitermitis]